MYSKKKKALCLSFQIHETLKLECATPENCTSNSRNLFHFRCDNLYSWYIWSGLCLKHTFSSLLQQSSINVKMLSAIYTSYVNGFNRLLSNVY